MPSGYHSDHPTKLNLPQHALLSHSYISFLLAPPIMTELSISDTHVIFIFSRDDPRRTILFDHRTSQMAYKVTTTGDERSGDLKYETVRQSSITSWQILHHNLVSIRLAELILLQDIVNAHDTRIAILRSRTLRSDLLTLADGTSVSESDWLKRNLLNEYVCLSRIYPLVLSTIQCFLTPHSTASFKDTSGAQFKWKVDKATQNMSVSRRTA